MNKVKKTNGSISNIVLSIVALLFVYSMDAKVNDSKYTEVNNYSIEELKQVTDSLDKEVDELIELKKRKAELIKRDSLIQLRNKKIAKVDSLREVEEELVEQIKITKREYDNRFEGETKDKFNTYKYLNNKIGDLSNIDYVYVVVTTREGYSNTYNISKNDLIKSNEKSVREFTKDKLDSLIELSKTDIIMFRSSFLNKEEAINNMKELVNTIPYAVVRIKKEDLYKFNKLYLGDYREKPIRIYPNYETRANFYYYNSRMRRL